MEEIGRDELSRGVRDTPEAQLALQAQMVEGADFDDEVWPTILKWTNWAVAYKSVNFRAEKSLAPPNRRGQMSRCMFTEANLH